MKLYTEKQIEKIRSDSFIQGFRFGLLEEAPPTDSGNYLMIHKVSMANQFTPFQIRSVIKRFISKVFHSCYENVSATVAREEVNKQIQSAIEDMNNVNW